ncbi:MAG: GNAT family N-acetyltransferase [Trueperaceae bacterium]
MRVREASRSDAAAVHALLTGIYDEGGFFVNDTAESLNHLAARLGSRAPDRSLYLVATLEGSVIGWLELHRPAAERLEHVAVLTLAVAPGARRQGVGRALMQAAYAWCGRVGALKVSLNVRASNEGAVALYLAEGFELEGRERGQVRLVRGEGAGFEDNLIMGRWLAEGGPGPR